MFTVKYQGQEYQFSEKITLKELAKQFGVKCYVATVNNRLRELDYYINYDCEVEFLDLSNFDAVRCMRQVFGICCSWPWKSTVPESNSDSANAFPVPSAACRSTIL